MGVELLLGSRYRGQAGTLAGTAGWQLRPECLAVDRGVRDQLLRLVLIAWDWLFRLTPIAKRERERGVTRSDKPDADLRPRIEAVPRDTKQEREPGVINPTGKPACKRLLREHQPERYPGVHRPDAHGWGRVEVEK